MSKLDVYLHNLLAGHLIQDDGGQMLFDYAPDWLDRPDAVPLSHSLPLRKERFKERLCRGFFEGLLPEKSKRKIAARNLGISAENHFTMLERIGGECAGAVTFMREGEPLVARMNRYSLLNDPGLRSMLDSLPRRPLMAGKEDVRLSLAGAQDKIAVRLYKGMLSLPLGNAPSTHILKPGNAAFEGLVFNEMFCLALADAVGLPAAQAQVGSAGDLDYLLVQRYDRRTDAHNNVLRIHQEDFCQALGLTSRQKYQADGGPTLKQCFDLVRGVSSQPAIDIVLLLDAVIFNALIGNHDAHGKNFSLLYDGTYVRLAPFYDLVSTVHYPDLSGKLAMRIGKEYRSDLLLPENFEQLAEHAGLARPLVLQRVPELAQVMLDGMEQVTIDNPTADKHRKLIQGRCRQFLSKFT